MSFSDSEGSSHGAGGEYKTFRQVSRERLLYEMVRSSKTGDSRSSWKVLIMDKVTVKVMSCSCKMADITDEGVSSFLSSFFVWDHGNTQPCQSISPSFDGYNAILPTQTYARIPLVEDLFRRRQPLPSMDAIYFIQPSKENIVMFLSDMSGREPLYKKAFVYFSSPIPKELVSRIKNDTSVLPRIGALREVEIMNLEYFSMDSQGYVTDQERALEDLFGEDVENSRKFDTCLNVMATRIATVFASLKEFPSVRYRAAKTLDSSTMTTFRDLVPTKLAAAVWNFISTYKSSIPNFPQTETCELLILDRSVDQIAPVIHEWTYDAMCHDLLDMDGNKYVHEIPSKTGGQPEKKEVLLEDHDPVWLELRHAHIADASERLHEKMTSFVSKNKAAQLQQRDGSEISTRDLQKMVQALPQYNEQMEKLSLHVEIAGKINKIIREMGLRELGQLEQDIVFGDAGTKEIINFFRTKQDANVENKLRLLMIYASVYPEKFEGDKALKLMQLAKLSSEDMKAVQNMRTLEGENARKTSTGGFSLKFDAHKRKHAARKDRTGEEETWQLFRFYPVLEHKLNAWNGCLTNVYGIAQELIEKLSKAELPKDEYQCMNEPSPMANEGKRGSQSVSAMANQPSAAPHSMRSRRTATWAKPRHSDDGYSSDSVLKNAASDFKKMGQRIFIFIIGGATRSELRVCHKLTTKLRREVVLGSSSIDDPPQYVTIPQKYIMELSLALQEADGKDAKWIPSVPAYKVSTSRPDDSDIVWVADVIDKEKKCWNKEKLGQVGSEVEVQAITSILLTLFEREDNLVWHHTPTGGYSVKLGYRVAMQDLSQARSPQPSSSFVPHKNLWKSNLEIGDPA
ncbi:hypothetical protein RHSIM_Rhsim01G0148400 [Rhododendron simsii]|uniref:SNARE-interacting protein KEULE n=1 Tax=Rhododendron simsii TaxID=118357 RepID=A0A834HCJ2_RHOSS|nr:hypothetical protein RHSIM_Rhsim01G0148400 [Rhododendron simsii]